MKKELTTLNFGLLKNRVGKQFTAKMMSVFLTGEVYEVDVFLFDE